MIVDDNGRRVRGFIVLSLDLNMPVEELVLFDRLLCLLASDASYIERMSTNAEESIEEAFREACLQILRILL